MFILKNIDMHLLGPEYFMLFLSADPASEIRSVIHDEGIVHHLPPLFFFCHCTVLTVPHV